MTHVSEDRGWRRREVDETGLQLARNRNELVQHAGRQEQALRQELARVLCVALGAGSDALAQTPRGQTQPVRSSARDTPRGQTQPVRSSARDTPRSRAPVAFEPFAGRRSVIGCDFFQCGLAISR